MPANNPEAYLSGSNKSKPQIPGLSGGGIPGMSGGGIPGMSGGGVPGMSGGGASGGNAQPPKQLMKIMQEAAKDQARGGGGGQRSGVGQPAARSSETVEVTQGPSDSGNTDPGSPENAEESGGSETGSSAVPTEFVDAIIQKESAGNPNAVSDAGAVGLAQAMPHTAKDPGFGVDPIQDRTDPQESRRFGKEYFRAMMEEFGSVEKGLMAYNWGPGNVKEWISDGADPEDIPAETRDYVKDLLPVAKKTMDKPVKSSVLLSQNQTDPDMARDRASKARERIRRQALERSASRDTASPDQTRTQTRNAPEPSGSGQGDPLRQLMGGSPEPNLSQ